MGSLDVETCTLFFVIVYSGTPFLNEDPGAEAHSQARQAESVHAGK